MLQKSSNQHSTLPVKYCVSSISFSLNGMNNSQIYCEKSFCVYSAFTLSVISFLIGALLKSTIATKTVRTSSGSIYAPL